MKTTGIRKIDEKEQKLDIKSIITEQLAHVQREDIDLSRFG